MTKTQRTQPWRQTPLIKSNALSHAAGCQIYLKLETLQPSGSFKSRGIGNLMLQSLKSNQESHDADQKRDTHFYSSSGGNAGLGCVHAAVTLGCPATIVVPKSTTDFMISKLRAAGAAEVIQHGKSWAEADGYLTKTVLPEARERGENAVYVHPFDAQAIWDGHATLIHEIDGQLSQNEDSGALVNGNATVKLDAVICSVGGGGLLCGIMQGLEETNNVDTQVIAMETKGADSLAQSLQQGKLVTLPAITSIATSLGARTVAKRAFEYGQQHNVTSVVLSDAQAVRACARFADDERILVEPACGVCMSICYEDRLKKAIPGLNSHSNVVIVVCGGSNVSLEILADWQRDFQD